MKRVVILCVWLFSVVAGHAQLSLDECRRLARENYPEIRQYDLVHQTEQYNLSNAARAWIPQLAFSAQATWQTDAPNFPKELTGMLAQQGLEIPGLRKDQYKVALELNQTIWDGGKSVADKRIAGAASALLGALCFASGGVVSPLVGLGNILVSTPGPRWRPPPICPC